MSIISEIMTKHYFDGGQLEFLIIKLIAQW